MHILSCDSTPSRELGHAMLTGIQLGDTNDGHLPCFIDLAAMNG